MYDEVTGLPLDSTVADAVKEELMFMRNLQVYHEVLVSYLDKSELKAIRTQWIYTNKRDAANPLSEHGWRKKPIARVDTGGREHVCGRAAIGESQVHAQSMHDWQPTGAR